MAQKAAQPTSEPALPLVDLPEQLDPPPAIAERSLDLAGDFEFIEMPVAYGGSEYLCPSCEQAIPTRKQINLAKPAKFAHRLNDVMKCPHCSFIFSYRLITTRVLRQ